MVNVGVAADEEKDETDWVATDAVVTRSDRSGSEAKVLFVLLLPAKETVTDNELVCAEVVSSSSCWVNVVSIAVAIVWLGTVD